MNTKTEYTHVVYTDEQVAAIAAACETLTENLPQNVSAFRDSGVKLRESPIGEGELLMGFVKASLKGCPSIPLDILYGICGMAFSVGIEVGRMSMSKEKE